MAKAEGTFTRVVEKVVLTLSGPEADTLRDILSHIGGCPDTSRRAHADAIMNALEAAEIYGGRENDIRKGSTIYFE